MKKSLHTAILIATACLIFWAGFQIGFHQKQEQHGQYYAVEGHCIGYDTAKNRIEFETPKGLVYYCYGDFEYTLDNLDFLLVMWDNNSEYLLDDYIVNYTPISKSPIENENLE